MKVKFVPQNVEFDIKPGESVMHVAQDHEIYIKSVCKGVPSCAECRVRVVEGEHNVLPPGSEELALIGTGHFIDRRRLSCQLKCFGDITVDMTEQIDKQATGGKKSRKQAVKDDRVEESVAIRGDSFDEDAETSGEAEPHRQNNQRPPQKQQQPRQQQQRAPQGQREGGGKPRSQQNQRSEQKPDQKPEQRSDQRQAGQQKNQPTNQPTNQPKSQNPPQQSGGTASAQGGDKEGGAKKRRRRRRGRGGGGGNGGSPNAGGGQGGAGQNASPGGPKGP